MHPRGVPFLACLCGAWLLAAAPAAPAGVITVDLEDLELAPDSFYNGSDGAGGFASQWAWFNNSFIDKGGFTAWSGWSYSNIRDVFTPGFGNEYAAYHLPGLGGGDTYSANYAVTFNFNPGDAFIALPPGSSPLSARITNTTYAALSMLHGDGFAKRFGGDSGADPDFFLLTIYGFDVLGEFTGLVEFFLADYRADDSSLDYLIDRWTTVDLTPLGVATYILFGLTSSDVGPFGINTPTYFALDNLEYLLPPPPEPAPGPPTQSMPEPATLGLVGVGALVLLGARTRRRAASAGCSGLVKSEVR